MFDLNNKKLVELISIEAYITCEHIFGCPELENIPYMDRLGGSFITLANVMEQSALNRHALIKRVLKKFKNSDDSSFPNISEVLPDIKFLGKERIEDVLKRMESELSGSKQNTIVDLYKALRMLDEKGSLNSQQKILLLDLETAVKGYSIVPRPILVVWYNWACRNINLKKYSQISIESAGFVPGMTFRNYADVASTIRQVTSLYTTALDLVNSPETPDVTIKILEPVFDMLFTPDTTPSLARPSTQSDIIDAAIDKLVEEHYEKGNESLEDDIYAGFCGASGITYTESDIQNYLKKLETTPDKLLWLRKDIQTTKFLSDYVIHLRRDLGIPVSRIAKITFISVASVHYKIDQAAGIQTKYYNPKKNSSTYTRKQKEKEAKASANPTTEKDKDSIKETSSAESAVNMIFTSGNPKTKQEKPVEQLRISTGGIQFKDCVSTTSSGIGLLEFYYHKVISHPNSTSQAKDWARRKLDTVNRMRALLLDLGSN